MTSSSSFWNTSARCLPATSSCPLSGIRIIPDIGQVFTRDQLLSSVWDQDYSGETRTVDVHVGTLRTKLGESGEAIRTVRGVGYRLG